VGDAVLLSSRLAEGGSPDTEIFRWMISPPDYIPYNSKIDDAYRMIGKSRKKCLLVSGEDNKTIGLVTSTELTQAFFISENLIRSKIEEAKSSSALLKVFNDSRKIVISMIIGNADPYSISLYISSIADAICRRAITLCLEEAGKPPCRFAFIQTGSAGRREQTLSTDQDNAIIFENCEGELSDRASSYFLSLGKKINNMLADAGFSLCKGENMAGNIKWCQPVNSWKKYFSDWIRMPGPEELLDVSIFFDFRYCYGDQALADELTEYVRNDLRTSDIFFHHMAAAWKPFSPSLSNTPGGKTDIKRILLPLTGIVRLYSLRYGVSGFSSIERILELYSEKYLGDILLSESVRAWKNLTSLRLSHQASCITKGTEPDNLIDFQIINNDLKYFAENSVAAINNLMLKAESDYHADTI
jgi:CBS domain-containing protein